MSDVPVVPVEIIATDVECIHCGYNLRGLHVGGRCPECGTDVQRSSQGNLLCYSDPEWLSRLLLGVRMALWTVAIIAGLIVCGMAVGIASATIGGGLVRIAKLVEVALPIAIGALSLASLFLITSQEPRISLTEDPVTLRKVLRTLGVIAFASGVLEAAASQLPASAAQSTIIIGASIAKLGSIVSYFGWFVYMRRFARRIPDAALEKSTTRFMWLSGVVLALSMLVGTIGAVIAVVARRAVAAAAAATTAPATQVAGGSSSSGTGAVVALAAGGFVCVMVFLALVFIVWYLRLLYRFRDAFRGALAVAQQPA
jgi:hypothetical protein